MTTINTASYIFPEAYSSTAELQKTGKKWNEEGGLKAFAAHTVIPVATIATVALDILVHTLAAVVKTAVWIPTSVVWLASFCSIEDPAPGANLPAILGHVGRAAGNFVAAPLVLLASVWSPETALGILDSMQLAPGAAGEEAPKSFAANLAAEAGVANKAKFVWNHKKDALATTTEAAKTAAIAAKDQVIEHKGKIAATLPVLGATVATVWQEYTTGTSYAREWTNTSLDYVKPYIQQIPYFGTNS